MSVATEQPGVATAFARTCAAEWTRLWTVRTTWLLVAAVAALMVGIGAAAGDDAGADPSAAGGVAWRAAEMTLLPGQFGLLALALLAVTSDYGNGGIVPTLQWTTRRSVLLLARALVAVGAATAVGVVLSLGSSLAAYAAAGPALRLPLDDGVDVLATAALVVAAGAAVAVGLGFVLRNTAGTLITVLLTMLVLPIVLPGFGDGWNAELAQLLPGSGAAFLLGASIEGMSTTSAVAVLVGWAAGALLLGWLRLVRTDANG